MSMVDMSNKKYFKVGLLACLFFLLAGCANLKPGDVIDNVEDYCYSEKEIWKEFKKRGFKEENITVLNFFGTQKPETIYTNYDISFNFNWDTEVSKESDEKHPEYNFLYITGDFTGYDTSSEELIFPKMYDTEGFQFWSINIYGKSWYASCVTGEDSENTGLVIENLPYFMLGENDEETVLTIVDFAEFNNDVNIEKVNKITHKKLVELAKTKYTYKGE